MDIGEFSKITGITIDTLRYYDKIEVLKPKKKNSRRDYSELEVEKALAITKLKKLNFSLDEIKALFKLEENIENPKQIEGDSIKDIKACLKIIEDKYKEIEKQEEDLRQVKAALEKMVYKTNNLIEENCVND